MAIKETTKKLHLIPFTQKKGRETDTDPAPTVTVNLKSNVLVFSKSLVRETGMQGKFVRLYFDPIKKVIAWQLREHVHQNEMKTWKLCKNLRAWGGWSLSIKKLLKEFDGRLHKQLYKEVPVQKYREAGALSEYKGDTFYFVELVDDPNELRKGVGNEKVEAMTTV